MVAYGGIDLEYATSLNNLKGEIASKLTEVSAKMSKQWGIDIIYRPARFLNCILNKILHYKINKLCDNCEMRSSCKCFEEIRRDFQKYNCLVFPYTTYTGRISNKRMTQVDIFFYGVKVKNILFVNSFSFRKEYENHPEYSALNNTCHEFLNTLPDDVIQQHILPCIPWDDFERFVTETNLNDKLLKIYGRKEQIPKYEAVIRYICNNPSTRCLLEALYSGDDCQVPVGLRGLFKAMKRVMRELKE